MRKRIGSLSSILSVFLPMSLYLFLESCQDCQEKCIREWVTIDFKQFDAIDLDTIHITYFEPDGLFDKAIDDLTLITDFSSRPPAYYNVELNNDVRFDSDWKIELPGIGRSFYLSEIQATEQRCTCEDGTFKRVKEYKLDGHSQSGETIEITK